MEGIKRWFSKQKLNVKFTWVIGIIVILPVIAIYMTLFNNIKQNAIKEELSNIQYQMNENYGEIRKTVELCNMSTQFFLNTQSLNDFLIKLKDNIPIETAELVAFNKNDIGMLERLVNSNPYLYQVRVYALNDDFPEMMPILYKKERMMQLPWADEYISGEWQFNYKDVIFPESVMNSAEHMMSLVTTIEDYEKGEIGVLEVAVRMDTIFPDIFQVDDTRWGCFIDNSGNIHSNGKSTVYSQTDESVQVKETSTEESSSKWEDMKDEIISQVPIDAGEESYIHAVIDGEQVIIGYLPVKELSGHIIQLVSIESKIGNINQQRNLNLVVLMAAFLLLVILINQIVKALLRRFYRILKTIREVQKGDIDVVVTDCGPDEMGELGTQINKMLEKIKKLIDENVKRELLMKDSELRALQNQINAHFIYNVLESIKMMAEVKEEYDISDAVTSLGKLLRYSMKWAGGNVTIEQEIEYIKNYLDLINLRFDYKITLALKIPDCIYKQEIPKMSLQPIVENAIIHGIEELAEDACIYMKAIIEGNDFLIEITDSGQGMSQDEVERLRRKILGDIQIGGGSGNGIGLKNVQDRIQMAFGSEYGIQIVSLKGCYTKVILKIPMTHIEIEKDTLLESQMKPSIEGGN